MRLLFTLRLLPCQPHALLLLLQLTQSLRTVILQVTNLERILKVPVRIRLTLRLQHFQSVLQWRELARFPVVVHVRSTTSRKKKVAQRLQTITHSCHNPLRPLTAFSLLAFLLSFRLQPAGGFVQGCNLPVVAHHVIGIVSAGGRFIVCRHSCRVFSFLCSTGGRGRLALPVPGILLRPLLRSLGKGRLWRCLLCPFQRSLGCWLGLCRLLGPAKRTFRWCISTIIALPVLFLLFFCPITHVDCF